MIRRLMILAGLAGAALGATVVAPAPAQAVTKCVKDIVCVPDCAVSVRPLWVRCYPY